MPQSDRDDKNKLNRIEDLKSKLFSRGYRTKIEHRESYSRPIAGNVPDSWAEKKQAVKDSTETFFMKTSRFKKFFVFSMVFFILTLAYASYVFFAGGNVVSNNNIDIAVSGNNFTAGGEELPLVISITNKNSTALDLVDLVMEYPKGGDSTSSADTEHFRESLGTILAGAVRNENVNVVLFGQEGSSHTINISIEYRVAGSSAIFVKDRTYSVNITSTPINLSVDAPAIVSSNQNITLTIKETLNATTPAKNILLKVAYPVGFKFASAVPAPTVGNNVWDLGDLAPGGEHDIAITGAMIDAIDEEQKTFNISTGTQSTVDKSVISSIFNSVGQMVTVGKPFVEADLFINGVSENEYATDTKTSVDGQIHYINNLTTKVNDLTIKAKISGNAFDQKSIIVPQGFYDSSTNTITWDKGSLDALGQVNPGDAGSVNFSLSPTAIYSPADGIKADPVINIEVDVSGKEATQGFATEELNNSTSAIIRLISDVGLTGKALYASGPFANTGPLPPQVEKATTYTIVWNLSNTANSISNAEVSSSLPPWVSFTGKISPATENLTYNDSTKHLLWNVGRIAKGAGVTGPPRTVSFQVSLKPSLSQAGTVPIIVNSALLTGHDDFANVDIQVSKEAISAKVEADGGAPADSGIVTQ